MRRVTDLSRLSTLYISYNGMTEPLVRSQVLSYQQGLAEMGVRIRLLTFEKQVPVDEAGTRAALAAKGIAWDWLPYSGHRGGKGTARDVIAGTRFILKHARDIDFVHCRSFVPALMAYAASRVRRVRYLYDVRGFWAHEKRYKGRLNSPAQFRVARRLEGAIYRRASAIVTLTEAGMVLLRSDYLGENPAIPTQVIPTCTDVARFIADRRPLDAANPRIVYSGSLGAGYLRDEVFAFFAAFRRRVAGASLDILSRSDPAVVHAAAAKAGLTPDDYTLRSLTPDQMAPALLVCDAALSFIQPDFSKIASCPTKMAEYLAAGLPVVANSGIGDVDAQLLDNRVGVVLDAFDEARMARAIDEMQALLADPEMIARGRETALRLFSLEMGIERYAAIYAALGAAKAR